MKSSHDTTILYIHEQYLLCQSNICWTVQTNVSIDPQNSVCLEHISWLCPTKSVKSSPQPKKKHNSNHSTLKPCWGWKIIVSLWYETTLASYSFQGSKTNNEDPPSSRRMAHLYYLLRPSLKNQLQAFFYVHWTPINFSPKNHGTNATTTLEYMTIWTKNRLLEPWKCNSLTSKHTNYRNIMSHFPNGISRTLILEGLGWPKNPWLHLWDLLGTRSFWNLFRHNLDHFLTYTK